VTTMDPRLESTVRSIAQRFQDQPGPLLEVLHAVQDAIGHVPPGAVPVIAAVLNLSRAEVHGVVSFYHHFRSHAPGQHTIRICRAEACQSVNGAATEAHAKRLLGIDYHQTTADGRYSLEPVYCLGNCACAPSVMIDENVHGRVTPERLDELLAQP
jgi:formate dehydrogenase subunit gamma